MFNQNQSKFNKGIFIPIGIVLILALWGAGIVIWLGSRGSEIKLPEKIIPEEAKEVVIEYYKVSNKSGPRAKLLPYVTGPLKKEIEKRIREGDDIIVRMSNPHPYQKGVDFLKEKQINSNTFEFLVREYEEYTGQGIISYNDVTYLVEKIENKYLITLIKYGERISFLERLEETLKKNEIQCPTPADCLCKWRPFIMDTKEFCPKDYEKVSGAYYDGKKCLPLTECVVPFFSIDDCQKACIRE